MEAIQKIALLKIPCDWFFEDAMHSEERFHRIQERAYELYTSRNPNQGSAEEDWRKAEQEIEQEEQMPMMASHRQPTRWRELLTHNGKDIDNPT
jgi:RecB family exonuclease